MIKDLINYYKSKQDLVNDFIQYSEYMVAGEYTFDETLTFIYLKDHYTSDKIVNMFRNNFSNLKFNNFPFLLKSILNFIHILIKIRFSKDLKIKNNNNEYVNFKGTGYLAGSETKDCKLFDLIDNKVITISLNKNTFNNKINNYKYFNEYFMIPEIINYDDNKLIITEEYIDFKANDMWTEEEHNSIIEDIFQSYIEYFKNCKENNNYDWKMSLGFINTISTKNFISSFIKKNIPKELMNYKFPFIKLHGDLWTSNILIDKDCNKNIYYIDWERSKEFIMFYDFFSLMWNGVYASRDYTYISKYILGEYDEYFREIFELFGLEFKEVYKKEYLSIFFLNYLNEWFDNPDGLENKHIFESYEKLLKKISDL